MTFLEITEKKVNLPSNIIISHFLDKIETIDEHEIFHFRLTKLSSLFDEKQILLILNHVMTIADTDKEKSFYLIRLLIEDPIPDKKLNLVLTQIKPKTYQQQLLLNFVKSLLNGQDYNNVLKSIITDKNQFGTLRRYALNIYVSINNHLVDFDFLYSFLDDLELRNNILSLLIENKYQLDIISKKIISWIEESSDGKDHFRGYLRELLYQET